MFRRFGWKREYIEGGFITERDLSTLFRRWILDYDEFIQNDDDDDDNEFIRPADS